MPATEKTPAPVEPLTLNLQDAQIVNPDGIKPVYSNNAAVLFAPHDVRIIFSEVTLTGPADRLPQVELRANVAMAATQFKALVMAVRQTLANYEQQFGEIKWPPNQ